MTKTILVTGATDGIGLETARKLVAQGHLVLLHGRNAEKLETCRAELAQSGPVESYQADLSNLAAVEELARAVTARHACLDVLINNAGVFNISNPLTSDGLDVRFVVNTLAPYLLTQRLLPLMAPTGRVVNLSSAAQAPVDIGALSGGTTLGDVPAYAQSKLGITMWSWHLADRLGDQGPAVIAVNPGSLLGTKMVKDAFGTSANDISIGADILVRAALDESFSNASGRYFDNDRGDFGPAHPDATDPVKVEAVMRTIEEMLGNHT